MIRQHQLIGGALALAAALIVSAAPAAWSDPALVAKAEAVQSAPVQSAPSGLAWGSIPEPDRVAAQRAAANKSASLDRFALIHVRAIPPTATVHSDADGQPPVAASQGTGPHSEVIDNGGYGFSNARATTVRVTSPGGFDWDDAGIGAAAGIAISMLALGLAIVISTRRARGSREPAAVAN